MLLKLSLLSTLLILNDVTARTINSSNGSIRANSNMGKKLMSKARRLEDGDADADDIGWMVNYDIKFDSCHAMTQYGEEGGGEDSLLYTQRIVKYRLCPSDACSSGCAGGGQYVVDMMEFVQAYNEYVEESKEQACEAVAENCDCENANDDDACEAECFSDAGLDYCIEAEGEEFELDRYLECAEIEAGQENNGNNNGYNYNYRKENDSCPNNQNNRANYVNEEGELQFFAGMYCDSERGGKGDHIFLGSFLDETCSYAAPDITYKCLNGGVELPFSASTGESVVKDDCISCKEIDMNADDDGGDPEILQLCEEPYERAGKCETGMEGPYYIRELECDFIQNVESRISSGRGSNSSSAVAWAWFFAICTLGIAGFAYTLYEKLQRRNVNLAA